MVVATVDPGDCLHALEPFNGTGVISAALRAAGVAQVRTNDLASGRPADLHEDALQPCFYRRYAKKSTVDC
jgi:hypothetical protein